MRVKRFNEKEIHLMEVLISSNQQRVKKIVSNFLGKHYKKVVETKEYIFAEGEIPIGLVAHMDTVFEESITKYGRDVFYDEKHNVMFAPNGGGFDDKAGVYAIINIIRSGLRPHVIFTTDEEIGAAGARALAKIDCPFTDLKYLIQLDRRGSNDCVFYDCDNKDFTDYVENFGFEWNFGSFSDISELCPAWEIAGVNLSVGYRDEHTTAEILFVGQLLSTISKVKQMLHAAKDAPRFEYIPSKDRFSPYGWYGDSFGHGIVKCSGCKKYYLEEEMFPAVLQNGDTGFYCSDCMITELAWCNYCGSAYQKHSPEAPSAGLCPLCLLEKETTKKCN